MRFLEIETEGDNITSSSPSSPSSSRQLLHLGSHPRGRVSRLEGSGVRPQDRTASSSFCAWSGKNNVNWLPSPKVDTTVTSPPCKRASLRVKAKPKPVPSYWRFNLLSS